MRVCLNAGAPVDARQEDKSTPLHFACAQGSIDMVQSMHEMQPERFETAMRTQDILNMTPLHRAALFDHVTVIEYLVKLVNFSTIFIDAFILDTFKNIVHLINLLYTNQ